MGVNDTIMQRTIMNKRPGEAEYIKPLYYSFKNKRNSRTSKTPLQVKQLKPFLRKPPKVVIDERGQPLIFLGASGNSPLNESI